MRALASAALTPTPSTSTPVETRLAASPASAKGLPAFRRALLTWYDRHRRDLPWRKTRDPYRIWLSEIMLQQTRVAAVLEHYRLFHERFPNVRALAAASESKVLAAWSGLGYYRRARMLRQCAREIVELHRGRFPKNSEALQALPGIGRYTAAAIASIAFDETAAVVDGNVERVLQRLVGSSLTAKQTWQRAQSHLSSSRPGDFNQAMMELGATVCTPRQPKCGMCPVRKWCATQGEAPRPVPVPSQIRKEIWCALDQRGGHVLLVQRPGKASLMAGMWELPQWSEPSRRMPGSKPASRTAAERRKITALWRTFRHSITVTDYTVHVIRAAAPAISR
ncbi:MAG: A/G-specific adenine glycosylase [Candidatus Koribacter versatilis]|nr:A/G-specific adenine glycosylase [Candidatus Koribacter versatilis]